MIRFPTRLEDCTGGSFRAGATDLAERRRHGLPAGPLVDLRDVPGLDAVATPGDGTLVLGAKLTLQAIADDAAVRGGWMGVARAAGALATPEIRAVATLGGSLAQEVRCWYYRHPDFHCLRKGGSECLNRSGDNSFHASTFDLSPCLAVHPSTMACALLTYDAVVETWRPGAGPQLSPLAALLGDGRSLRTLLLGPGELVTKLHLPAPAAGEKSAYWRAISRARAEWPVVECSVRLGPGGAKVALGGVAPVPFRVPAVEAALDAGQSPAQAAARVLEGVSFAPGEAPVLPKPLPLTRLAYDLLVPTIVHTLEMAS